MLHTTRITSLMIGLRHWPRAALLALGLMLLVLVSAIDYRIDASLSLFLFYLFPTAIAAWFVEARAGYAMALLSAAAVSGVQLLSSLNPQLFPSVWNGAMVGAVGILMADLLQSFKVSNHLGGQLSRVDTATGAINERFFLELLEAEFHRAERHGFALTLAYIYIHNLNQLLQRLGESATDELLCQFVEQVSLALRTNDVVARLGNNEFAILLPQTDDGQAQQVFTRIQEQLSGSFDHESDLLEYSIGVTAFLEMPETPEDMMTGAEAWLAQAKNGLRTYINYQVFPEPV
jgi:diguanylate cyclase (GGDEF)-like protein